MYLIKAWRILKTFSSLTERTKTTTTANKTNRNATQNPDSKRYIYGNPKAYLVAKQKSRKKNKTNVVKPPPGLKSQNYRAENMINIRRPKMDLYRPFPTALIHRLTIQSQAQCGQHFGCFNAE